MSSDVFNIVIVCILSVCPLIIGVHSLTFFCYLTSFVVDDLEAGKTAFENSEFYILLTESSRKSLASALSLLHDEKVNVKLRSYQPDTAGMWM